MTMVLSAVVGGFLSLQNENKIAPLGLVLEELFALRGGPIADRRLQLLSQIRRDPQGKPILEDVLRAFLKPALEAPADPGGASFVLLRARLAFEQAEVRRAVIGKAFDVSNREFLRTLREAYWRVPAAAGVSECAPQPYSESTTGPSADNSLAHTPNITPSAPASGR